MRRAIQHALDTVAALSLGLMDVFPEYLSWMIGGAVGFGVVSVALGIAGFLRPAHHGRLPVVIAAGIAAVIALASGALAFAGWRSRRRDWM